MADGLMMMPWYPRDFRSSTLGWPLEARAVYRELLDAQWDLGELPENPERLRMIAGATPDQWAIAWPLVAPKLPLSCSSRKNLRLEEHREKARSLIAKRSLGARSTNAKRWGERSLGVSHPSPSPSPSPEPKSALRSSSSSPNSIRKSSSLNSEGNSEKNDLHSRKEAEKNAARITSIASTLTQSKSMPK